MNKRAQIEREVQKALDQFERAEKLPPNPFFFTRIWARLESKNQPRRLFPAILRPALLATLVTLNLMVWFFNGQAQTKSPDTQQQLIEILASDLRLENDRSDLLAIK